MLLCFVKALPPDASDQAAVEQLSQLLFPCLHMCHRTDGVRCCLGSCTLRGPDCFAPNLNDTEKVNHEGRGSMHLANSWPSPEREDFGDNIDDTKVVNVSMHANDIVNSDYEARGSTLPGRSHRRLPGARDEWSMKGVDSFQDQLEDAMEGKGWNDLDRAVPDSLEERPDRRAEYLRIHIDDQIRDYKQECRPEPGLPPEENDMEEVNFMQRGAPPTGGWFNKAMREFRWLRSRSRHAKAARLLRDKLRRVRNPKIHQAAQAHLRVRND